MRLRRKPRGTVPAAALSRIAMVAGNERLIDKVIIAYNASGRSVDDIVHAARRRNIPVEEASPARVKLLAGNGRHDQGVPGEERLVQRLLAFVHR